MGNSGELIDIVAANRRYADGFGLAGLARAAGKEIAIVTCMDPRIDPLAIVGLAAGDAVVLRNAGGRVTDAVLSELSVGIALLGVKRIVVIQHTGCAMATHTERELQAAVAQESHEDGSDLHFAVMADQVDAVSSDLRRVREFRYIPHAIRLGGFIYDVGSGALSLIDEI